MRKYLLTLATLVLILSACRSTAPTMVETDPPDSQQAVETMAPTETTAPTLPPTETPLPTPTDTPEPTATASPTPFASGPDEFPAGVNPLTGLAVGDAAILDRRPMAFKIQTFPRGQRMPWGISQADIVYDYYQNDGLTRLYAVFYSRDAEQVGPIRSARMFDTILTRMYRTVFAFGGADQRVLNRLYAAEFGNRLVIEGNDNCPPMCRIDPNQYNYLVSNTEDLSAYAEERGVENGRQDLTGMQFDPQVPDGGEPVEQVFVRYSISAYNRWDYDAVSGRYQHFVDNAEDNGNGEVYVPLTDRFNDEPVTAENVVVLFATHQYWLGNNKIVDILLNGSGRAVAFRDGQAYELRWNRPTTDSLVFLTFPDGTRYSLKPGVTWYQVVGESSNLEKPAEAVYRFSFNIP